MVSRETASLLEPIVQLPDGSHKMELYLDLHKFKPNEIAVSTKDGTITVEANAERRSEVKCLQRLRYVQDVPDPR